MPYIFIRHGEKMYKNGSPCNNLPAHDPPLKNIAQKEIKKLTIDLVSRFGYPKKIITSPYWRTRQTSELIRAQLLETYDYMPGLEIEKDIGEFLGHQRPKGKIADLEVVTQQYTTGYLGTEGLKDCKNRIISYYINMPVEEEGNVWVITHGILLHFLYKFLYRENRHFEELEYFIHPLLNPLGFVNTDLP